MSGQETVKEFRDRNRGRRAYRPRPPFRIIEGWGTAPFDRLSPYSEWVLGKLYAKFNGFNRSNLSLTYGEVSAAMSGRVFNPIPLPRNIGTMDKGLSDEAGHPTDSNIRRPFRSRRIRP